MQFWGHFLYRRNVAFKLDNAVRIVLLGLVFRKYFNAVSPGLTTQNKPQAKELRRDVRLFFIAVRSLIHIHEKLADFDMSLILLPRGYSPGLLKCVPHSDRPPPHFTAAEPMITIYSLRVWSQRGEFLTSNFFCVPLEKIATKITTLPLLGIASIPPATHFFS